jgi:hypothetical protein
MNQTPTNNKTQIKNVGLVNQNPADESNPYDINQQFVNKVGLMNQTPTI